MKILVINNNMSSFEKDFGENKISQDLDNVNKLKWIYNSNLIKFNLNNK